MNIENIVKIKKLSIDQDFEKRFKFYKKKYGYNLQKYQFLNMIKNEPEEFLDYQFYYLYQQQDNYH